MLLAWFPGLARQSSTAFDPHLRDRAGRTLGLPGRNAHAMSEALGGREQTDAQVLGGVDLAAVDVHYAITDPEHQFA